MTTDARIAYREAAVRGASQIGLVVMLYNMLIEDVSRAIVATRDSNPEARSKQVIHALSVLEQLQGTLNMKGGEKPAVALDQFYSISRAKLLEAHIKSSAAAFEQQLVLFISVREAWQQVEVQTSGIADPDVPTAAPSKVIEPEACDSPRDWSA